LLLELDSKHVLSEPSEAPPIVGIGEVKSMFFTKALNAYFMLKRAYGNPKYKQVISSVKLFANLCTMAKRYLCNNFENIKMG
jgi:hypothetical protein